MKPDALIVVDVQQALVDEKPWHVDAVLSRIAELLEACRAAHIPVLYIQHEETEGALRHGALGWQIAPQVAPMPGEQRIIKQFGSAFRQTSLHAQLTALRAKRLILCGMQTEYCVDATCKGAAEYGYDVVIPKGGTTTFDNGLLSAAQLIEQYETRIWRGTLASVMPMPALLDSLHMV